jgi:hypothetical protein
MDVSGYLRRGNIETNLSVQMRDFVTTMIKFGPGCNIDFIIDLHCKSQNLNSVPHRNARSGSHWGSTNITKTRLLLSSRTALAKAQSFSKTGFRTLISVSAAAVLCAIIRATGRAL